jgi:hypothetical protein
LSCTRSSSCHEANPAGTGVPARIDPVPGLPPLSGAAPAGLVARPAASTAAPNTAVAVRWSVMRSMYVLPLHRLEVASRMNGMVEPFFLPTMCSVATEHIGRHVTVGLSVTVSRLWSS